MNDDYTYFLNGLNPETNGRVKLALDDIKKSGLNPPILEDAKVKIFRGKTEDLKAKLGFASFEGQHILQITQPVEFPNFNENREIVSYSYKLCPSINGTKYLMPKGISPIPYILPLVWEVKGKAHKPVWITEGQKKALKLLQHGRYAISLFGVFNFRSGADKDNEYLFNQLKSFDFKARTVFLAFDRDVWFNGMVRMALYELTFKLMSLGALVRFPKWKDGNGIDDYLAMQKDPEKVLNDLEGSALLPEKFIQPDHQPEVLRGLSEAQKAMDALTKASVISRTARVISLTPRILADELQTRAEKEEKVEYTEAEHRAAIELLKDPKLVDRFKEFCHKAYLGREKELILLKLATITRHDDKGQSIVITGPSAVGKSALVGTCLLTVDSDAIEEFTRVSAQYLLYRKDDLNGKVVTFFELNGTSDAAPIIRTAMTEGKLVLGTVTKDSQGRLAGTKIEKDTRGLVVLSTYTGTKVDYELSTRVLTQEISHDPELATNVYLLKCPENGLKFGPSEDEIRVWRLADRLTEPKPVRIPWQQSLAVLFPTKLERFHRDYDKVIALIRASARLHQYQRAQSDDGYILADRRDYELVYSLADIFIESVSEMSEKEREFLEACDGKTKEDLENFLKVTDRTVERYIKWALQRGLIEVEGKGKNKTVTLIEIPEKTSVLPKPDKIFKIDSIDLDVGMSQTSKTVDTVSKDSDKGQCQPLSQMSQNDPDFEPEPDDPKPTKPKVKGKILRRATL